MRAVEEAFWRNPYARNLRSDHLELEVRLGQRQRRRVVAGVGRASFCALEAALQQYTGWDCVARARTHVAYFERHDGSLRAITDASGRTEYTSKQRLFVVDYELTEAPFDLRTPRASSCPCTTDRRSRRPRARWCATGCHTR